MKVQNSEQTFNTVRSNYFTRRDLGQFVGRSDRTLARWDTEGFGPPTTQIGRLTLYRKDSVLAWLQSLESKRTRRGR